LDRTAAAAAPTMSINFFFFFFSFLFSCSYEKIGILKMLRRNVTIKEFPERLQDADITSDVVITLEERVYDLSIERG
jgi:hypothetical protein